jgi:hypothetical protein
MNYLGPIAISAALMFYQSAFAAPGAHGPNGEHLEQTTSTNTRGLSRLPDGSVNVPKLAQRRMGVRTLIAPESDAALAVQLPAKVTTDPNASGLVQSSYGGRVEPGPKGLPVAGQAVRQGETLAWVRYSADPYALAGQQAQRAELQANLKLAQQRLVRLLSLEGSVPRKEIDAARIDVQSLEQRERSISTSLEGREALRAPISGVIAHADLKAGQIVDSRAILVEVVDPGRLMVEASTPDVSLGDRVQSATLAGIDGVELKLVGAARALRDGVLPLTFRASAAAGVMPLAVGQTVTLVANLKERRTGIVLPAEAIVRSPSNESVVWIKTGAERYMPQPVQFQPLDSARVLVTQGLAADNRVVVQGAALIAQIR